ncbi:MAG: carboxypeptidase-like regulatory domain-containing protein, partial [Chitinophagaceae bacterium]
KKDYQYLLLKVTGNNLYSIATPFNFSSLKKRIAMMNKIRSARVHLVKFMFVLPLVAVLLLAFRSKWHSIPDKPVPAAKGSSTPHANRVVVAGLVVDAKTLEPIEGVSLFCSKTGTTITTDANGYYKLYVPYENEELKFDMVLSRKGYTGMKQSEHWGNFYNEGIYKAFGHTIELFALTRSSNGEEGFSRLAGNPQTEEGLSYENIKKNISKIRDEINRIYAESDTVPLPPAPPAPAPVAKLPDNVISIKINNGVATVLLKNGSKETYNISNSADKKSFEEKYGDVTPAAPEAPYTNEKGYNLSVTDSKGNSTVVVKDKNNKEVKRVLLNTWKEKAGYYENLYGELPPPPPAPPVPAAAPAPLSAFGGSDPVIVQGISTTGRGSAHPALSSSGSNEVVVQGYPLAKTVKGQLSTTSGHDGIAVQGNPFSSPDRAVTSTAPDDPKAVVVQGHPFSTTAPLSAAVVSGRVLIQDDKMDFTEADEVITITISKNDSREKLNEYVRYMKENGAELNFEDIAYNKKGELTRISGKIRSRINTSTFSGEDFSQVVLLMYRKGDKTWFNIRVTDDHERI